MRWLRRLIKFAAVAVPGAGLAAVAALPRPVEPPVPPSGCTRAAEGGTLRVLSLNLKFSALAERGRRLDDVAALVARERVEIVLLQEVAGGILVGTWSTAADLQARLWQRHDLRYARLDRPSTGIPGLLSVGNAILSRCPLGPAAVTELPEIAELDLLGRRWRIGRNLLGARVEFGEAELAVYTTHLCAQCAAQERARQLEAALQAISAAGRGGAQPLILGGDLNLDLQRDGGAERPLYARLQAFGLRDSALVTGRPPEALCAAAGAPDPTCTVGVAVPARPIARRIDYVLAAGPAVPVGHRVVFNPRVDASQPWVSNHAGVLVEFAIGGGADSRAAAVR